MENLILIANIIFAILLVVIILLQSSEGGALGIGASQDSYISSRSAGNFLTKATAVIATFFIITSILLTILSRDELPSSSVIDQIEEKQDSSLPKIPISSKLSPMSNISQSPLISWYLISYFISFALICCWNNFRGQEVIK